MFIIPLNSYYSSNTGVTFLTVNQSLPLVEVELLAGDTVRLAVLLTPADPASLLELELLLPREIMFQVNFTLHRNVSALSTFIIWQVMKYREICIKYNQYLKKLYFHM